LSSSLGQLLTEQVQTHHVTEFTAGHVYNSCSWMSNEPTQIQWIKSIFKISRTRDQM